MTFPWGQVSHFASDPIPTHADVVVIGAGVAGCAVAHYLAEANVSVCVLEKRGLGQGASGRCIGLPWHGLSDSPWRLNAAMGAEATDIVLQLSKENHSLLRALTGLSATGCHWANTDTREPNEWLESLPDFARNQIPAREQLPSGGRFTTGIYLETESALNPVQAIHRLAAAAQSNGALIVTHAPVLEVMSVPTGTVVRTSTHTITADAVVFAAGAWGQDVLPWLRDKIVSVREHVQGGTGLAVHAPPALRTQNGYIQWIQQNDHWAISGARWASPHLEVGETDDTKTHAKIQNALTQFRDLHLDHRATPTHQWSYLWAKTCDGLPIVGPLPGRSPWVCCTGFMGNDWGIGIRSAHAVVQGLLKGQAPGIPEWMTPARFV